MPLIFIAFLSCDENKDSSNSSKISQGIVEYDIVYPDKVMETWSYLLPKKMTMTFKNNIYKNEISIEGLISSSIIANCNKKTLVMVLDFGLDHIYTVLDENETENLLKMYPNPDIISSNLRDSIVGMSCNIHYGIFEKLEDGPDAIIHETKKIDIQNSNWCNQYNEIKGVMLTYNITQFGLNMKFKASNIYPDVPVENSTFDIPADFNEVPLNVYLKKMNEIFSNFL